MDSVQDGTEIALLLARPDPLPSTVRVEDLLRNLPRLARPIAHARWFSYEESCAFSGDRRFDVSVTRRVDDPLVELQGALKSRLAEYFPRLQGVIIPTRSH
jgi:hypothetical protein